jgi:outer membrane protein TolC
MAWLVRVALVVVLLAVPTQDTAGQGPRAVPATRVGVVLDGSSEFNTAVLTEFQREITAFFGTERAIEFPPRAILEADWTAAGTGNAIDRLLADPGVDIVIALGAIGSNELAHRKTLPKPAIAALIVDPELQDLPREAATSGVRNLSYVNVAYSATRTLTLFHELVPFRKLAVLIHPGLLSALPGVRQRASAIGQSFGASIEFVPVTSSAAEVLRGVPEGTDAVYLTPLAQLPTVGVDSLISGFTVRRLPTFAYAGRREVERGVLAAYAPQDDLARRARRVAGNIRRILNGENAGTLPIDLVSVSYLTVNMATARAIGFSPGWTTLTEAELLNAEPPAAGPTWSLARAAQEAVRVNLDLQAAGRAVASGVEDVHLARASLLPQVQSTTTGSMIRQETAAASLGQQPERQLQGGVSFSQTLIDDQTWASYSVAGHQQTGREADRRRTQLDVVLQATTAYLNVLSTRAIARIERENLRVTRSNLEVAQLRERTGAASLADVYRWESELATSRKSVIDADARVQVAALELNRVLNRPLEEPFQLEDTRIDDSTLFTSQPGLFDYFGNPETFAVFRDFMVAEGRTASPELRSLDAALAAQRRVGTAAGRAFWLPTVSLQGGLSSILSRGGAGAEPVSGPISLPRGPDDTWSLKLQASLPIFTGFARGAARAQANIDLDRLTIERQALERNVAQQVRAALQLGGASWADIQQARAAAEAARKNLELVSDAYARGAVSIITLVDAQEAALNADEAAAGAVYAFLSDLMKVERAIGEFYFLRTPEGRQAFLKRLDDFYRAAGVTPRRQ